MIGSCAGKLCLLAGVEVESLVVDNLMQLYMLLRASAIRFFFAPGCSIVMSS